VPWAERRFRSAQVRQTSIFLGDLKRAVDFNTKVASRTLDFADPVRRPSAKNMVVPMTRRGSVMSQCRSHSPRQPSGFRATALVNTINPRKALASARRRASAFSASAIADPTRPVLSSRSAPRSTIVSM
jgi:hypothetical protein